MNKKVNSNKYIELYFDEELSIYSWKFLSTTEGINTKELKEIIKFKTSIMKEYRPKYVIADDRKNLATFNVEIQEWIAGAVIDALKYCNAKKFAVIRPKEIIVDLSMDQTFDEAEKIADDIEIRLFAELKEAEDWIKS